MVTSAKNELENDKWMKGHLVARTEEKIIVVEQELESMNISIERNDIPNFQFVKKTTSYNMRY